METLRFDTFGPLLIDGISNTWLLSQDEWGPNFTYPYDFIPCEKCKKRKPGRPPWWKYWLATRRRRQENDDEGLQDQRFMPELGKHKTHIVPSSPFPGTEQEEIEDWDSDITEWEESVVASPSPIDGQEDVETYADVPWNNRRALASISMRSRSNGYSPYSASYDSDHSWDKGGSDWDLCSCHDGHGNDKERLSNGDHLPAGFDGAPSTPFCEPNTLFRSENMYDDRRPSAVPSSEEEEEEEEEEEDETASQIEYVMVPRAQPTAFRALQDKHDGGENLMEIEPSIEDVLYIIKRWLASTTRRVTDAVKRWLGLVRDWIREAYNKMREMLATTTRPNQQREDEDVD
ncbi:hypothetical protein CIB48_g4571 [Xylaria polymorpha]|nr:hypothetical protein CIB48_g4571 [Xylaria polymorpha]